MNTIVTVAVVAAVGIGIIAYFKQAKATKRAQRAVGWDNLFIYPSKQEGIYLIKDNYTKDILSIAKDLDDGTREYIIYTDNKATATVIDNADEILKVCTVDESGNIDNLIEGFQGNIKEYEWLRL